MKKIALLILLSLQFLASAQTDSISDHRKSRYLLWTYHEEDVIIHGLSVGLYSTTVKQRNTTTNGIRLELLGSGALVTFRPQPYQLHLLEPLKPDDEFYERVNGLSISP